MRRTSPAATVALGAVLSVGALLGATAVIALARPGSTARFAIVGVAFVLVIVGAYMMLKDLTPGRRR